MSTSVPETNECREYIEQVYKKKQKVMGHERKLRTIKFYYMKKQDLKDQFKEYENELEVERMQTG